MPATRELIISNLRAFIAQRPGFDWGNYSPSVQAYRSDVRLAGQQLRDAREMLRAVEWRTSIDAAQLTTDQSGRLTVNPETGAVDYCAGQYWCTEYRAGVCRLLAGLLWSHARAAYPQLDGDGLRRLMAREYGRGLARRWFF